MMQSGPTDVWKCLKQHTDLFMRKVSRVVIRANLKVQNGSLCVSEEGKLVPDVGNCSTLDRDHTGKIFTALQDLGIPMTVVTRFAGYSAKLSFSVYDRLGETRHPVGQRLVNGSRAAIEFLWGRCLRPTGDPHRSGLPAHCNKQWFCKT